jgi:hypothetical protein
MSKTVENVIIVILIIAIVYMLFANNSKSSDKNKKVQFGQTQQIECDSNLIGYFQKKENMSESTDPSEVSGYDGLEDYEQLNNFVDEYKDVGRFTKKDVSLPKGSEEEINAYRKSFLDFRSYTNNTTNGFDAVDKMNLEKIQDESKGMKISDVYDRITANNYKESNIDVVGMTHNEKVDNTIRTNEFRYDSDTVNNGAPFFGNVTGYDNESHEHVF